jgi:hypothetical protein
MALTRSFKELVRKRIASKAPLREGINTVLAGDLDTARRFSATTVTAHAAPRDGPQRVSGNRRACAFDRARVISIVHRLAARRPMITHYGRPIIGGNDMQGEQCKANNASCLSILASGRRPAIFRLRSVTVTELNTACFGR